MIERNGFETNSANGSIWHRMPCFGRRHIARATLQTKEYEPMVQFVKPGAACFAEGAPRTL
jgi:hypothetical protein